MNYNKIDEAMLPFFEYVQKISILNEGSFTDKDQFGFSMNIESVHIEMPFEMDIDTDENGQVTIGVSPPMYYVATSIEPVFHSLKVTMELTEISE